MPQPHESSQNPLENNKNFIITQIASGLSTTTELIQSLSAELKDNTVELAIIKVDLTNVRSDVKTLSRILREGNGSAPVLSRIAVLETSTKQLDSKLENIEKSADKVKAKLDELSGKITELADRKKIEAEDKKSRRQVMVAIITSVLALISAIIAALL